MPGSSIVSMANGALDAFVKETMEMMGMDPTSGLSAADNEILVYAPRTFDEIEILKPVIEASYKFAVQGQA